MKLNQIITSLLETDMYKFSMGEAIYHQFSDYKTTWTFKCRNTDVHFTAEMVQEIKEQIKAYCSLRFTEEELEYLNRITWIKGSYIDFLRLWQPRYEDFKISDEAECGLSIETFGTWLNTSLYEIPTAIPSAPLTRRFGTFTGKTTGSFSVSSKFGMKSTTFLSRSAR